MVCRVNRIADSFTWPFRNARAATWAVGLVAVLLLPLAFIPLLGYAIAATRAAEVDLVQGPPRWKLSRRLFIDGLWTSLAIALTVLPFAVLWHPLAILLGAALDPFNAHVVAALVLALPWGLLALLHMPHATARFATTQDPRDMLDLGQAIRGVRRDFQTWNVVVAAIVTAWAIGLACAGALCVGVVAGIYYAILVSAHAAAALHRQREGLPAR